MYLDIQNLTKSYIKGPNRIVALDRVSLTLEEKVFVALTGPSGSGKTTLLNLIGGLDFPDSGSIKIDGIAQARGSDIVRAKWRSRNIGYVFQSSNLIPFLTAAQNVALPLLLTDLPVKTRQSRVATALRLVGLEDRDNHKPDELSGGQEQRVAIARALVANPKLLLCDEPTGDLDRESAQAILLLLKTLSKEFDRTIIMVTHDLDAASQADRQIRLQKGRLTSVVELPTAATTSTADRAG